MPTFIAAVFILDILSMTINGSMRKLNSSLVFESPGLEMIPVPGGGNAGSRLIWYQYGHEESWRPLVDRMQEFLQDYENVRPNVVDCSWKHPPGKDQVCHFNTLQLGNYCIKENLFGYYRGSPCIIIKMNKILDWVPLPYNYTNLHADMHDDLKHLIAQSKPDEPMVWISCEGETPADSEMLGPIQYIPSQGFPSYYFPYKGTSNYFPPFVFVRFLRLQMSVVVSIECKAWALNIDHNGAEHRSSVRFELLID